MIYCSSGVPRPSLSVAPTASSNQAGKVPSFGRIYTCLILESLLRYAEVKAQWGMTMRQARIPSAGVCDDASAPSCASFMRTPKIKTGKARMRAIRDCAVDARSLGKSV